MLYAGNVIRINRHSFVVEQKYDDGTARRINLKFRDRAVVFNDRFGIPRLTPDNLIMTPPVQKGDQVVLLKPTQNLSGRWQSSQWCHGFQYAVLESFDFEYALRNTVGRPVLSWNNLLKMNLENPRTDIAEIDHLACLLQKKFGFHMACRLHGSAEEWIVLKQDPRVKIEAGMHIPLVIRDALHRAILSFVTDKQLEKRIRKKLGLPTSLK